MKPPFATVGSFSEFFLDGMMDDDDDDARFCLNRSSDDDGRRACPSVSAMAASVDRPRRRESVPARCTCAGYALSTRVMKWAPWSTLNGSLTRRAEIDELALSLSDESQCSTARPVTDEWRGRQDRGARRCIDGRGRYVPTHTHPRSHARRIALPRRAVARAPVRPIPFSLIDKPFSIVTKLTRPRPISLRRRSAAEGSGSRGRRGRGRAGMRRAPRRRLPHPAEPVQVH